MPGESGGQGQLEAVPAALRPAVEAAAAALRGVPATVLANPLAPQADRAAAAAVVLQAAVDARAIVSRTDYDNLDSAYRQAVGRFDRISLQMAAVGDDRQDLERLCHRLAEALGSGRGREEALEEYRGRQW